MLFRSKNAHPEVSACLQRYHKNCLVDSSLLAMQDEINHCFKGNSLKSIVHALETRSDAWHEDTRQVLEKKSPLASAVTLAQLRKAKTLSLAACLQMDFGLVRHFMQGHDFYEGVRAILVDKDQNPRWQPKSLQEISQEMVLNYFV